MNIEITVNGTSWYLDYNGARDDAEQLVRVLNGQSGDEISARIMPTMERA